MQTSYIKNTRTSIYQASVDLNIKVYFFFGQYGSTAHTSIIITVFCRIFVRGNVRMNFHIDISCKYMT